MKTTLPDGRVYEGEVLDGRPHGKGKLTYADGGSYEGEWLGGEPHGKGKVIYRRRRGAARRTGADRELEHGPVGAGATRGGGGLAWVSAGAANTDLAFAAAALREGRVLLAGGEGEVVLPCGMTSLRGLFTLGPTHDRIGHPVGGDGRGAFEMREWEAGDVRDVSLWAADANTQRTLQCQPTHTGRDRGDGREEAPQAMRELRGRVFFPRGLRYTSQALGAAWTRDPCHGGRAWTSARHDDPDVEKAFMLWSQLDPGADALLGERATPAEGAGA